MDLNDVFKTYRNQLTNIEFVRSPITRAKHAAVPIETPTGDHCILAADAILELLRRLISALNIFQKVNKDTWNIVTEYMSILEKQFPSDMECKYFIEWNVFKKIKEETDEFWANHENESTKNVRDVGKEGFTVEDLEEELKYLRLTDVFPEIIDYAEDVYAEVDRKKNEKFLRTCDMFDALEHCQLLCIFNRFPNLIKLLHTQKACRRVSNIPCDTCPIATSTTTIIHKRTTWKEYSCSEITANYIPGYSKEEIDWTMECSDNLNLRSNYQLFSEKQLLENTSKYFLMGLDDVEWYLINSQPGEEIDKCLLSLENFTANHNKRIYIRSIPWEAKKRIFTDDVLESIPILLKQQGTSIDSFHGLIQKYQRKWKCEKNYMYNSIDLEEFKTVLEEFDIDKNLITVVPDMVYDITAFNMSHEGSKLYVYVFSPDGKRVMDISQAIFHIFQSVVCGINWTKDYCKEHPDCIKELQLNIINVMAMYGTINNNIYVTCENVQRNINYLQDHCTYQHAANTLGVLYERPCLTAEESVPTAFYNLVAEAYDFWDRFDGYKNTKDKEMFIPVWMYRLMYMIGWIQSFFIKGTEGLHDIVRNVIIFKIPQSVLKKEKDKIESIFRIKAFPRPSIMDKANSPRKNCVSCTCSHEHTAIQESTEHRQFETKTKKKKDTKKGRKKKNAADSVRISNDQKPMETSKTTENQSNRDTKMEKKEELDFEASITKSDMNVEEKVKESSSENDDDKKSYIDETSEKARLDSKLTEEVKDLKEAETGGNPSEVVGDMKEAARKEVPLHVENKEGTDERHDVDEEKEDVTLVNASEEAVKELESCSNCLQIIEECNKFKTRLEMTQYKLETAEDIAKMFESRSLEEERISRTCRSDTEIMFKEMNTKLKEATEEASDTKQKLIKTSISEKKLKESNKKLTEKNRSLEQEIIRLREKAKTDQVTMKKDFEEKIAQKEKDNNELVEKNQKLGQDMIHLLQTIDKDQNEKDQLQKRLNNEIFKNGKINTQLEDLNSRMLVQNEEKEKTIQTLRDRISSIPSTSPNQREEAQIPGGWRFQLVTLQKIKDTIRSGNALKLAKDTVEKLISLTNQSEIHQMANYELSQFEGNLKNYLQAVEPNIQKLKETRNVTDLPPLPDYPSLSERFMKEYWNEIDKQRSTSSEKPSATPTESSSELADSECLICTEPMESTGETIKCENCRRRYHSKCLSEWLKRKSVCPTCSRGLLDPAEYPTLGSF